MEVSKRIKKIVDMIANNTIADIGTDHCYIPIHALKEKKAEKAIASDVNREPLKKGQENIEKEGLSGLIETRLGNGLEKIKAGEAETLIIAGMGGMLMIDILEEDTELLSSFSQLILQPQSDIEKVRKFIHRNGFLIHDENMILDMGKYYTILDCRKGTQQAYSHIEYTLGKANLQKMDREFIEYLKYRIVKKQEIIDKISINGDNKNNHKKILELNKEIENYKELISKYES